MDEIDRTSQQKYAKAIKFINDKHTKRRCIWCGVDNYKVVTGVLEVMLSGELDNPDVFKQSKAVHFFPVYCDICGFTYFFSEKIIEKLINEKNTLSPQKDSQEKEE